MAALSFHSKPSSLIDASEPARSAFIDPSFTNLYPPSRPPRSSYTHSSCVFASRPIMDSGSVQCSLPSLRPSRALNVKGDAGDEAAGFDSYPSSTRRSSPIRKLFAPAAALHSVVIPPRPVFPPTCVRDCFGPPPPGCAAPAKWSPRAPWRAFFWPPVPSEGGHLPARVAQVQTGPIEDFWIRASL